MREQIRAEVCAVVPFDELERAHVADALAWVGSHPRATVERELKEELGIVVEHAIGSPLMLTCAVTVGATAGHTDVSLWYVVQRNRERALDIDESEFIGVKWFDFSDIPRERVEPNLSRFVAKLQSRRE